MMNLVQDSREKWLKNIPAEWSVIRVKNIFKLSKEKNKGEIIDVLSLTQQGIKVRDITDNDGQIAESYDSYTRVRPGDIVFNPMDLRSGSVDLSKFDGVISLAYTIIRKKPNVNINLKYYSYYFYWHYLQQILFPYGKGVSTDHRWTLQDDILMNFPVLCPKKEDQNTMSELLDKKTVLIDQIIEKKQKLIGLLQEKRSALITHAVTKGLDPKVKMKPSGIFWIDSCPTDWKLSKIKRHVTFQSGYGFPNELQGKASGAIPFLKVSDINGEGNYIESASNYVDIPEIKLLGWKKVPAKSILTAKIGAALSVNHRKINNVECIIDNNMIAFKLKKQSELFFDYFFYISKVFDLSWFSNPGTVPSVNITQLKELVLPFPMMEEQKSISSYIDIKTKTIQSCIKKIKSQTEILQKYRSSLIYHAVTGKIKI